jgi:hypothetical protein
VQAPRPTRSPAGRRSRTRRAHDASLARPQARSGGAGARIARSGGDPDLRCGGGAVLAGRRLLSRHRRDGSADSARHRRAPSAARTVRRPCAADSARLQRWLPRRLLAPAARVSRRRRAQRHLLVRQAHRHRRRPGTATGRPR